MSRSYRHQPVMAHTTARSEKFDKMVDARRLRRETRRYVQRGLEDQLPEPAKRITDPYGFAKDGKAYLHRGVIDLWFGDRAWRVWRK
ncbi:MAG: hypothetical protein HYY34_04315 [Chloroflexi bacterium]|nr:hypothetical protein [Chloroflexota bacterium]